MMINLAPNPSVKRDWPTAGFASCRSAPYLRPLILQSQFMHRLFASLLLALLTGCIAYAPSATDWRRTPKVVLQICSPASNNAKAQVVLYRSGTLPSFSCNVAGFQARTHTSGGQEVFETMLENPSPLHEAIGVSIRTASADRFYVFAIPRSYSSDWSSWTVPLGIEAACLAQVDRHTYPRKRTPLSQNELLVAPQLRVKVELPSSYEARTRPSTTAEAIPPC